MTTYARSNPRAKWHIVTVTGWTLCYHNAAGWETSDEPVDYTPVDYGLYNGISGEWEEGTTMTEQPGEVCKACQAVHEAQRTGKGVPF